jgi:hypothetical protein
MPNSSDDASVAIVYSTQSTGRKFAQRCQITFTRHRANFIVAAIAARSTGQEVIQKRCASSWRRYWKIQTIQMADKGYHFENFRHFRSF